MNLATDRFDTATLAAALSPSARARAGTLEVRDSIDSTQAELLRRGRAQPDGSVLLADTQTAGRGRRGRVWVSPPGANLYLSMFRRVSGGVRAQAGLSLALGIAAAETVRANASPAIGLKWPNDLVADGRKLGGLLVETLGDGDAVVAGIGINLRLPDTAHDAIDQPWTDLAALGCTTSRCELAAALVEAWFAAFDTFATHGLAAFSTRWDALDALRDAPVRVIAERGERTGIARGIAPSGALRVAFDGGTEDVFSGDVSLRRA